MRIRSAGRREIVILVVVTTLVVGGVMGMLMFRGDPVDGAAEVEPSGSAGARRTESRDSQAPREAQPSGDAPDDSLLPPIVTSAITDETTRDLLWLWSREETAPPRTTIDNSIVVDGLGEKSRSEVRLFDALIDDDPDRILSYLVRSVRPYLAGELRSEMESWKHPRNVVLLASRDDRVLRYGIISDRGAAAELILYLEGNLVIDGELVKRDWSRRNSLAANTGPAGSGPLSY